MLAVTPPRGGGLRGLAHARGPLIDAREHPQWRQFILQAAYGASTDEVERLRDLPTTPVRMPLRFDVQRVLSRVLVRPRLMRTSAQ